MSPMMIYDDFYLKKIYVNIFIDKQYFVLLRNMALSEIFMSDALFLI